MKKLLVILLVAAMAVSMISCEGKNKGNTDRTDILPKGTFTNGITVSATGKLLLDGKELEVYGVNLYDVFVNKRAGNVNFDIETPFRELHESGISVARINMGSYYIGAFSQYVNSPDEYFEALDAVVAAAEKYEIGIFASLCWNLSNIWEYCDEYCFSIANKSSKTMELAKQYFTDVVKRYKDSPAIWAWEFGNEYNLAADLCFVQTADYITSENISIFYQEVSSAIREIDPYRLIVGGDSELSCRPAALRNERSWRADTVDDVIESTLLYAPSPMEAVSSHMYQYGEAGATIEETEFKDFDAAISMALEACKETNKGYYIGEYGPGDFLNNGSASTEINKYCIDLIHSAMLKNKVQVALAWLCTNDFTGRDSITDEFYGYWYDEIVRINSELKADGKQDNVASYWAKAEKKFYTGEDYNFNYASDYMLGAGNPGIVHSITDSVAEFTWSTSNYSTNASITLEDATLADGTTGKIFHIVNSDASAKTMLKYTNVSGLKLDGHYKLSFYIKTSNMQGSGMSVKMGTPAFGEQTGIKCTTDGEWQYMEFDIGAPTMGKNSYSITLYLTEQIGDVSIYGIKITDY